MIAFSGRLIPQIRSLSYENVEIKLSLWLINHNVKKTYIKWDISRGIFASALDESKQYVSRSGRFKPV
jgi:hypothetical protein